jgi:uroporphyrinogen-III synthase
MAGEVGGLEAWALRPAGEHAALRRLAQAAGLRLRSLAVQRLSALAEAPAAQALAEALAQPLRVFTSPAAVRFASRHAAWRRRPDGMDLAVGAGTAAALREAGASQVAAPARMDSEGLLALPELAGIHGRGIGLVTAPGGRGLIGEALLARGARLRVAEVYRRRALHGGARRIAALLASPAPLAVSSGEALERLHGLVVVRGEFARRRFVARPLVVSSGRLAARAAALGFEDVRLAAGPDTGAIVHALVAAASGPAPYNGDAAAGRASP